MTHLQGRIHVPALQAALHQRVVAVCIRRHSHLAIGVESLKCAPAAGGRQGAAEWAGSRNAWDGGSCGGSGNDIWSALRLNAELAPCVACYSKAPPASNQPGKLSPQAACLHVSRYGDVVAHAC